MPYPDLDGTVGKVELYHPDGVGRVAGILNALPERAQEIQQLRGPATAHCWDLVKYKGKDVSGLPYVQRRYLAEKVIDEIRFFNSTGTWSAPASPGRIQLLSTTRLFLFATFWRRCCRQSSRDPAGGTWFKVKQVDFADLELVEVLPGTGKYSDSVGDWLFGIQKTEHSERSVHSQSRMRGVNGSGLTERTWSELSSRFECKR